MKLKSSKNKLTTIPEVISNPTSTASEQYRTIATNLQFMIKDKNLKSILITSPEAGAGKTTTIVNIATILAQNGKSVLFIDGDLRKPTAHRRFGIPNIKGLTNVIVNDSDVLDCIQNTDPKTNLKIMTSGPIPPNPSEILSSKSMDNFLTKVNELFDIILIDTPPTLVVSDAKSLSTKLDGAVIVARYNQSKKIDVQATVKELTQVNANVLGVVINDLPKSEHDYYYGK